MATAHSAGGEHSGEAVAMVDPRAPRVGNAITAAGLGLGIALAQPALVVLVAAILLTAVVSRWRYDPYALLWRRLIEPVVAPEEPEPAAPHRFAKLLGASGSTLASVLLLGGFPLAGYVIAGAVALAAALAATTGICIGCRMYRSVSFVRRLNVV